MSVLSAQPIGKAVQYQADAKNNKAEAPGTANIAGTTGSVGPLDSGAVFTIPQPGKGFPTGKTSTHSSGTYPKLTDGTMQQCTKTVAGTVTVSAGMAVSADSHVNAGSNDLQNYLASNAGENLVPTPPTGSTPAAGLSQAPEHE